MISKEQKIKIILDIENGTISKKALPVFKRLNYFCISEKDLCINDVYFNEDEFKRMTEYLKDFGSLLFVQNIETMQNIDKLISN